MMRSVMSAVAVLLVGASTMVAGEPVQKNISNSDLSAMGLSGMTVVSDEHGAEVRGMGFSFTSGLGFAAGLNPFGGFSSNNYNSGGGLFSGGNNYSTAGSGLGGGFGFSNLFGFGGGFGAGQFGGGGSGSFGF